LKITYDQVCWNEVHIPHAVLSKDGSNTKSTKLAKGIHAILQPRVVT
jgi:hypothetical protein